MYFWVEELGQELYNDDSSCSEGTSKSVPKVNTPSANSKVINEPEIKFTNQIKYSEATKRWDDYLGPNQTNINPRTGKPDPDRIFSADGTRSVRFTETHEMPSMNTTKAHYHEETWTYNPQYRYFYCNKL